MCCWKKYMKLKRVNLMNPPNRAIMSFFIETINIQNSVHINQIKNENSDSCFIKNSSSLLLVGLSDSSFSISCTFLCTIISCTIFIANIIYRPSMARKAPHTHTFTSVLYLLQWYYFLWRYLSEKWTVHNTHHPLIRNGIPYPPKTFRNWKIQKTR